MNKRFNFDSNKKLVILSIYILVIVAISACIFKALMSWGTTASIIRGLIKSISPFLIGFFIAFVMNPVVVWFEINVFKFLKSDKWKRVISILISYVLIFGFIIVSLVVVVPQIVDSISDLIVSIGEFIPKLADWVTNLQDEYPDFNLQYLTDVINNILPNVVNWLQNFITKLVPTLYDVSMSIISWVLNLLIAIIVSCYMLIDKEHLLYGVKRIAYALFRTDIANLLSKRVKECSGIFTNFIVGKSIDSLIIGILCFIIMKLLDLDYALLISLIVGITNMIPYFGPFIGAIPGILILLMVSLRQGIEFAVLIFVLQQFDGLYLGPKILGDSTGLKPLWIIFAITFGGWLAGPIGMFLGVPCIAVIAYLSDMWIDSKLKKRGVDLSSVSTEQSEPEADDDKGKNK